MRNWLIVIGLFCATTVVAQNKHQWGRTIVNTAVSFAIDAAVTYSLKPLVRSERPDGSDCHSFPSTEAGYWLAGKIGGKKRKYDVAIGGNGVLVVVAF